MEFFLGKKMSWVDLYLAPIIADCHAVSLLVVGGIPFFEAVVSQFLKGGMFPSNLHRQLIPSPLGSRPSLRKWCIEKNKEFPARKRVLHWS